MHEDQKYRDNDDLERSMAVGGDVQVGVHVLSEAVDKVECQDCGTLLQRSGTILKKTDGRESDVRQWNLFKD